MNIGIDARSMFGTPTGVGRYLSNLLQHIRRLDTENHYCLYSAQPVTQPIIQQNNFSQKALRVPLVSNYFTWNHFRLPMELFQHPVDLFHFPFYTIPVWRNYRSIVTIHDITYEVHPEWYSWKGLVAMRYFSKYAAQYADKIITDSENTKQDIVTHYKIPEDNICVIPLGVEKRFTRFENPAAVGQLRTKYTLFAPQLVLYIGSIHTRRNIEQLIRAFERLCQKNLDAQLLLVGKQEYPYLDVTRLLRELELDGKVIVVGYCDDDELPPLYNLADLFIYPSSYEGFGLPPLEAMACGTPVITCRNSSLPEVVGEAALFVDPLNIQEMADAMREVLANTQLQKTMIARGDIQAQKFSWERTAKETLAVYRSFQ